MFAAVAAAALVFFCYVVGVVAEALQQQYESQEGKAAAEGVMREDALKMEVAVAVCHWRCVR